MLYAEVVLPIALDRKFHYIIPDSLQDKLVKGSVVIVPFRNLSLTGYCVGLTEQCDIEANKLKEIKSVIEDIPPINDAILQLTRWIADYYLCSWGEALEATLPSGVRKERKRKLKVPDAILQQANISESVAKQEPFTPTKAQAQAIDKILESINNRIKQDLTENQSRTVLVRDPVVCFTANNPDVFLLHGITGSGKTEVYLQVIDEVIKNGRQAIVLVPEISLTPQTVRRFRERFADDRIAVLHSYLTAGQRADQWRRIKDGLVDVVIGARSAIFAPTKKLGIVVIDEEHETSFKQETTPRYHARDVAVKRAEIEKAVVVLGSATPSLESYYLAQAGHASGRSAVADKYQCLELPERIENRPLPHVDIVDMTQQKKGNDVTLLISKPLETAIRYAIQQKEQVILLLNRRGYLTLIMCPRCKYVIRCPHCQVALTYHKDVNKVICHHCSEETVSPSICPECGHAKLARLGSGTERVEETIRKLFTQSAAPTGAPLSGEENACQVNPEPFWFRVNRVDSDVMRLRESGNNALDALGKGQIDILVGTQMVAKGLDFPNVTLVGIISADTALYLKDFRSAERTFQLITQVAGRTGRSEKGGRVILQTVNAQHYSISYASRHDYHAFAKEELEYRKSLFYPPYSHLLRILVEHKNESRVKDYCLKSAEKIHGLLDPERYSGELQPSIVGSKSLRSNCHTIQDFVAKNKGMEILGPSPCPWAKIKNKFRWQIVIKSKTPELIQSLYRTSLKEMVTAGRGIKVTLDMDPLNLL